MKISIRFTIGNVSHWFGRMEQVWTYLSRIRVISWSWSMWFNRWFTGQGTRDGWSFTSFWGSRWSSAISLGKKGLSQAICFFKRSLRPWMNKLGLKSIRSKPTRCQETRMELALLISKISNIYFKRQVAINYLSRKIILPLLLKIWNNCRNLKRKLKWLWPRYSSLAEIRGFSRWEQLDWHRKKTKYQKFITSLIWLSIQKSPFPKASTINSLPRNITNDRRKMERSTSAEWLNRRQQGMIKVI